MTRGTKLGGGALVLAAACAVGWIVFGKGEGIWRIDPHLRLVSRKLATAKTVPSPRMAKLPNIYLWAWERPEDLRFLGGKRTGVAFLAKTLYLKTSSDPDEGDGMRNVVVRPRMQPLRIEPGTPLMAVVRIEAAAHAGTSRYTGPGQLQSSLSIKQLAGVADEIAATTNLPGVNAVQIDFDATLSEHNFYRALLVKVRKRLPNEMPLSITALASWCIGDRWLEQLPPGTIDEAVPMLFRMGAGGKKIVNHISSGKDFGVASCGNSLGVSTDETFSRDLLSGKLAFDAGNRSSTRVYVFNAQPWGRTQAEATLKGIESWRAN